MTNLTLPLYLEDDIVLGVLVRNKAGELTDVRARNAIRAYITSLAPDSFLTDADIEALEVYTDVTLQIYKRADTLNEDLVIRLEAIKNVGAGNASGLAIIRSLT